MKQHSKVAIIIHQAICGEVNKGWDLLRTTLPDQAVAKNIAFKSDLQDRPPAGLAWAAEVRGFAVEDNFVFMKTYQDNSPLVRKGRVFSHCLIADKAALSQVENISELLNVFRSELDKSILLETLEFNQKDSPLVHLPKKLQGRFNAAIKIVALSSSEPKTIVWAGQEHYPLAVIKLWQILSPQQREMLNFGIYFNPSEIPSEKLNFVCVPENLISKFLNNGFPVIKRDDSVELTEFTEQFIAGDQGAIEKIAQFVRAIECDPPSNKDVITIAKGINTFQNVLSITDITSLYSLANIIDKYSPKKIKGKEIKDTLINRLVVLIANGSPADIFLLRKFKTGSFNNAEMAIQNATIKWCKTELFEGKKNQTKDLVAFIVQVFESTSDNWLLSSIKAECKKYLGQLGEDECKQLCKWIDSDRNILPVIMPYIDSSRAAETALMKVANMDIGRIRDEIKQLALSKTWLRLYAKALTNEFEFEKALEEQLKVDIKSDYYEGLVIINEGVDPIRIVQASLESKNNRCVYLAGQLCAKQPTLLKYIDINNILWQKIWTTSIRSGNVITAGIANTSELAFKVLDLLVAGKPVDIDLLELIGESPFGNILHYPKRSLVWSKIDKNIRLGFLTKTSAKLLELLSEDPLYQVPTDRELSDFIMSSAITDFLYYNRANMKAVLPIFNTYHRLPQHIIRDYLFHYNGPIDAIDSTYLGKIISSRKFEIIADLVYEKTLVNSDFRYALKECTHLLGFFTLAKVFVKGLIDHVEISDDQWWSAFADLSMTLYSGGPSENKVWSRAKGEEYDIVFGITGKEAWIKALKKLRIGGCTRITVKKLLKTMKNDYQHNPQLRTLIEIWEKQKTK